MTEEEKIRYARMTAIAEIGTEGMERLRSSRVFIVGSGALGSPVAMYLAGSGVGTVGFADFDTIDISNLHRQLFYETGQAGRKKAEVLKERIVRLNPECKVNALETLITEKNAPEIFSEYDFIIDATDNPSSKFLIEKTCVSLGKPYTTGGVSEFHGQVISWEPGHIPLSELLSAPSDPSAMPCMINGVAGPAAGLIAAIEASEAIKHLAGIGEMLYDKLFTIDLLTMETHLFRIC